MKGSEFEKLIVSRLEQYKKAGLADIGKYGVQASFGANGIARQHPSKPDFEGVFAHNQRPVPVIFDAKVCSQSSFALANYMLQKKQVNGKEKTVRGSRRRQLEHMLARASYGVLCGFLIHWNERETKTAKYPAETYWFPVRMNSFWKSVERKAIKSIRRADCRMLGIRVEWSTKGRSTKQTPDPLAALRSLVNATS